VDRLLAWLTHAVKHLMLVLLRRAAHEHMVSLDWIELQILRLSRAVHAGVEQAWRTRMLELAKEVGLACPSCGRNRKVKLREAEPMILKVLGGDLKLPKVYLECGHCAAPGVSVTRLLTGLSSGETSGRVALQGTYLAAQGSYAAASRDLAVHGGQQVERTKVRRLALEVEAAAVTFAEAEREQQLERLGKEGRQPGVALLMVQGDGGMVRTGELQPCAPTDSGYGKTTPKRALPRRKRELQYREVITLDVRQPGAVDAQALDALVPATAPEGERSRRMLALAGRAGLGDDTKVRGLGDMGSGLAEAFDEAFVAHDAKYSADWRHTSEYGRKASLVLEDLDQGRWQDAVKEALWQRKRRRFNDLLRKAKSHRCAELPAGVEKCPLQALQTYGRNNWDRFWAAEYKEAGLDFVSARAEAHVRERTKGRFDIPGAWRTENLEPKAIVRSIIAEGRWQRFALDYLRRRATTAATTLRKRLSEAVEEGRLSAERVEAFLANTPPQPELAEEAA
jgi:hypothetical protein